MFFQKLHVDDSVDDVVVVDDDGGNNKTSFWFMPIIHAILVPLVVSTSVHHKVGRQ